MPACLSCGRLSSTSHITMKACSSLLPPLLLPPAAASAARHAAASAASCCRTCERDVGGAASHVCAGCTEGRSSIQLQEGTLAGSQNASCASKRRARTEKRAACPPSIPTRRCCSAANTGLISMHEYLHCISSSKRCQAENAAPWALPRNACNTYQGRTAGTELTGTARMPPGARSAASPAGKGQGQVAR